MRKIKFKVYCKLEEGASCSDDKWGFDERSGLFHGFFQKTDYNRFGADHKVIAIIEDYEGQIFEVSPDEIRFIEDNTLKVL